MIFFHCTANVHAVITTALLQWFDTMNKNANSADVRCLTEATPKDPKSLLNIVNICSVKEKRPINTDDVTWVLEFWQCMWYTITCSVV